MTTGTSAAIERPNAVTLGGNPVTLLGPELKVGDPAPDLTLTGVDFKPIRLADYQGKVKIISWLLSVDTGVCDRQTKRLNSTELPPDTVVITASMDTPFALKRYCGENNITHAVGSAYNNPQVAINYGVLQKERHLPARALVVVGKDNRIVHVQYCKEIATEPDYDAALAAAQAAAAR